jgi:hypothetical protein
VVALFALLTMACGASGGEQRDVVAAAAAGAAPAEPHPAGSSRVLQGRVVTVDHEGGRLEAAIYLQWWPEFSDEPQHVSLLTDAETAFGPAAGGIGSLRPGDDVQVVVVPQPDGGWRALEVVRIDID